MTDPIKAKIQELCPDVMDSIPCTNPECGTWVQPPITLAVVLRAIHHSPNRRDAVFVGVSGTFYDWDRSVFTDKKCGWNLQHDDYDQQSEETKAFIGSLFNV